MRAAMVGVIGIALLAGCNNGTTPIQDEISWQGSIQGGPGWEQITGTAAVEWQPGTQQFATSIQISGDEPGAVRPWHVHFNTCVQGGGIVGVDADYPRLVVGADGTASVATTVPMSLSATAPYHVNVHLSEAEMATIIACGDLETGAATDQSPTAPGTPGEDTPAGPGY